ncbi:MAG: type II secretion system protein GspM [Burkholderiales bacterium]
MMALALHRLSPRLAATWEGASARERALVLLAIAVVVGAALYTTVWVPVTRDRERLARDLPVARAALATARAQADALLALQRAPATTRSDDPRATVERVLAERRLRPAVSLLDVADGRVRLTFGAVRFDALPDLLAALGREGVRTVEAVVTARVEPGTVRAEFTFAP